MIKAAEWKRTLCTMIGGGVVVVGGGNTSPQHRVSLTLHFMARQGRGVQLQSINHNHHTNVKQELRSLHLNSCCNFRSKAQHDCCNCILIKERPYCAVREVGLQAAAITTEHMSECEVQSLLHVVIKLTR